MPGTYEPIATQTLASAAASVTFSSIPSTYTDLVLIMNAKGTGAANPALRFNGDTATNYSSTVLHGSGSTGSSFYYTTATSIKTHNFGNAMNGVWTSYIANIQNYSNTTTNKSCIMRYNATSEVDAGTGSWRSTSAITSVTIVSDDTSYDVGSTFTLYGIKAA
jgi:hypothetical protein